MRQPIVSIEVDDNFGGICEVDSAVEVGECTDSFCVTDEGHFIAPSLFLDVSSDEFACSVGRVVIDVDHPEVGIVLGEDGVEVVFVPLAIVIGGNDENKRLFVCGGSVGLRDGVVRIELIEVIERLIVTAIGGGDEGEKCQ